MQAAYNLLLISFICSYLVKFIFTSPCEILDPLDPLSLFNLFLNF